MDFRTVEDDLRQDLRGCGIEGESADVVVMKFWLAVNRGSGQLEAEFQHAFALAVLEGLRAKIFEGNSSSGDDDEGMSGVLALLDHPKGPKSGRDARPIPDPDDQEP